MSQPSQPLGSQSGPRRPLKMDELFDALKRELEGKPLGFISDIYLQQGKPPVFFCCSEFVFPNSEFFAEFQDRVLTKDDLGQIVNECYSKNEEKSGDLVVDKTKLRDFAFSWRLIDAYGEKVWRVRAHVSTNYSGKAVCLRLLSNEIPDLTELEIPTILGDLAINNPTGLIIVSGGTGSGKSTTAAAIIKAYSETRKGHIATLEDPVEYILDFPNTLITQHWVGVHYDTWSSGIRSALRDKVDMLMIGELRDPESVRAAIQAASSGHIVLATAHFASSVRVLNYLESMFPPDERDSIRTSILESLLGVCCQKLLPSEDFGLTKPVPCYELFVNSETISNNLNKEAFNILPSLLENAEGCVSWDYRLDWLLRNRIISQHIHTLNSRRQPSP